MEEINNINEFINRTFDNIQVEGSKKAFTVLDEWKKVLLRIKSAKNQYEGQNLCNHSRVVDYKNGILLIEADHPGWIELLQLYKNFIVKGINMDMPELKVKNLAFRLKGNSASLSEYKVSEKEIIKENEKKLEEEERKINLVIEKNKEKTENPKQKKEMPPELKALFEELKNDMLTNEENKC